MNGMYWKRATLALGMGAALCWGGTSAQGQGSDAILDLLVRKGIVTDKEAADLKKEADADLGRLINRENKTKVASWISEMKWSNDLRLRAEFFDNEDQSDQTDRLRFRYRLRLGFTTKFNEWATVGFGLASGSASDPVSTNESFDDSFQKDPIQIDLAYVTLQPPGMDWISVTGGKMKNPVWQTALSSPMVYDHDLTPEGLAEQLAFTLDDAKRYKLFGNMGQWVTEEIGSSSDTDGFLFEFQGGLQAALGGADAKKAPLKLALAGGYYFTENAELVSTADSPNAGNAGFVDDFEVLSARAEAALVLTEKPFLGTPCVLTVSGEYIKNISDGFDDPAPGFDEDQTDGYSGQIAFGGNKKKGEWQVAYQYKHLEADATWDAFTDSDWGTGGTDRKGHVLKASYNLFDWWQLGATAFLTEKISDRSGGNNIPHSGNTDEELLRLQFDSVFKF